MSLSEDSTNRVNNLYDIFLLKIHTLSLNLFLPYKRGVDFENFPEQLKTFANRACSKSINIA